MPYNNKCLFKCFNLPSVACLRGLLFWVLLLVLAPNVYSAGDSNVWLGGSDLAGRCGNKQGSCYRFSQTNACGSGYCYSKTSSSCSSYTDIAGRGFLIDTPAGFVTCCPEGTSPSPTGACISDDPLDDCSSFLWGDLSGDSSDGSCDCPSPSVNNGFGSCVTCGDGQVINSSGECAFPCPGNLQLVNGSCGCLAGQTLGTFNGVQSCQASSTAAPITQGGGTLVTESGTTINVVNNADGTTTTTTITNNNTTVVGGSAGSGTGGTSGSGTSTISSGTSTMSITTDASGHVVSATGSSQSEEAQDSLTLPAVLDARELSIGEGISQAFANAPIVSALNSALGAFPTSGACSVISLSLALPYNPPIHVNMSKQCDLFADIANYLTMFAMVVYGLLSYKVFIRSASGV